MARNIARTKKAEWRRLLNALARAINRRTRRPA